MISVEWKSRIHQYFLYTMSQKSGTARKSGLLYTGAVGTLEKFSFFKLEVVLMHRQSSIPFNQSGIGVRAITMTAKTAPANAAVPIAVAVFLLRFFFTALQISMAQTTQTAAAASTMTSVSHNHESSYNILIRSPYLSLANWDLERAL